MPNLFGPALWCLLAAALFGISPAGCKQLLGGMGALPLASLLYLGAGISTLPFSIQRIDPPPDRSTCLRLVGAIIFGGILGPILLMIGLTHSEAGTASLLLNFETVATILLGWLLFREHLSFELGIACLLVVGGGIWLSLPEEMKAAWGALWILLACFCWGFDNHFTAVIDGITPTQTTCIKGLVAGACSATLALLTGQPWGGPTEILGALAIGALCYGASMVLYVSSAQQLGATRSQMIFASAPYWGLVAAWLFLEEPVQLHQLGASALMIMAMWLLLRERHEHEHHHHELSHIHWHRHRDGHHNHQHPAPKWQFFGWHIHHHKHPESTHTHAHRDDLHHRHH